MRPNSLSSSRVGSKPRGFTLIELLIVVAIIAILAAIAVPNFLEAQTRSKVSRVRADLRTVATAIETYAVDHNAYPTGWDILVDPNNPSSHSLFLLSTPIAYLSSGNIQDVFSEKQDDTPMYTTLQWDPMTDDGIMISQGQSDNIKPHWWMMFSCGPDLKSGFYDGEAEFDVQAKIKNSPVNMAAVASTVYDPTNGTTSLGNIWRVGGESSVNQAGIYISTR